MVGCVIDSTDVFEQILGDSEGQGNLASVVHGVTRVRHN